MPRISKEKKGRLSRPLSHPNPVESSYSLRSRGKSMPLQSEIKKPPTLKVDKLLTALEIDKDLELLGMPKLRPIAVKEKGNVRCHQSSTKNMPRQPRVSKIGDQSRQPDSAATKTKSSYSRGKSVPLPLENEKPSLKVDKDYFEIFDMPKLRPMQVRERRSLRLEAAALAALGSSSKEVKAKAVEVASVSRARGTSRRATDERELDERLNKNELPQPARNASKSSYPLRGRGKSMPLQLENEKLPALDTLEVDKDVLDMPKLPAIQAQETEMISIGLATTTLASSSEEVQEVIVEEAVEVTNVPVRRRPRISYDAELYESLNKNAKRALKLARGLSKSKSETKFGNDASLEDPDSESENVDSKPLYCKCMNPRRDEVSTMIECNGCLCPYGWWHHSCAGLEQRYKQRAKWFCPECRATNDDSSVEGTREVLQQKLGTYNDMFHGRYEELKARNFSLKKLD